MAFSEQLVIIGIALGCIFGVILCCYCTSALCCNDTALALFGTPSKSPVKRSSHNKYRHRHSSYSCSFDNDIEYGNGGNYEVTNEDDCCDQGGENDNDCCDIGGGDDGGGCDSGGGDGGGGCDSGCGGGDDS